MDDSSAVRFAWEVASPVALPVKRNWNEPRRVELYGKLGPFEWFKTLLDPLGLTVKGETGDELFLDLYERIFAVPDEDEEYEHFYFDRDKGSDAWPGTMEQPFKTLWPMRFLLHDPDPERKIACHLKGGCTWAWETEASEYGLPFAADACSEAACLDAAAALQESMARDGWLCAFTSDSIENAARAFCGSAWMRTMLACPEGRKNVFIRAWGEAQALDGHGIAANAPVLDGTGAVDSDGDSQTGLAVYSGHQNFFMRDIRFTGFRVGIFCYSGTYDAFYRLGFDAGISQHAIQISQAPHSGEFQMWSEVSPNLDFLASDDGERAAVDALRAYRADLYPGRILIGFCDFDGVGSQELPNGAASVMLTQCATQVCIDHGWFTNNVDGVTTEFCSTGHLVLCCVFKDLLLCEDGTEDGNGIDLKAHTPRTPWAFVDDCWNGTPRPTAIFDNDFYDTPTGGVILHRGAQYVEVFNNYFRGCFKGVASSYDVLEVFHPKDLDRFIALGIVSDVLIDGGASDRAEDAIYLVEDALDDLTEYAKGTTPGSDYTMSGCDLAVWQDEEGVEYSEPGLGRLPVEKTSGIHVYRNIFYGCDYTGIEADVHAALAFGSARWGSLATGVADVWVAQNTICCSGTAAVSFVRTNDYDWAGPRVGSFSDLGIFNNLFYLNDTLYTLLEERGTGLSIGWDEEDGTWVARGPSMNNTIFFWQALTPAADPEGREDWALAVVIDSNAYWINAPVRDYVVRWYYHPSSVVDDGYQSLDISGLRTYCWDTGAGGRGESSWDTEGENVITYPGLIDTPERTTCWADSPFVCEGYFEDLGYLRFRPQSVVASRHATRTCPGEGTLLHFLTGEPIPESPDFEYCEVTSASDAGRFWWKGCIWLGALQGGPVLLGISSSPKDHPGGEIEFPVDLGA